MFDKSNTLCGSFLFNLGSSFISLQKSRSHISRFLSFTPSNLIFNIQIFQLKGTVGLISSYPTWKGYRCPIHYRTVKLDINVNNFENFFNWGFSLILSGYIWYIERAGSTFYTRLSGLDGTTECTYGTCCTGSNHATFRGWKPHLSQLSKLNTFKPGKTTISFTLFVAKTQFLSKDLSF